MRESHLKRKPEIAGKRLDHISEGGLIVARGPRYLTLLVQAIISENFQARPIVFPRRLPELRQGLQMARFQEYRPW